MGMIAAEESERTAVGVAEPIVMKAHVKKIVAGVLHGGRTKMWTISVRKTVMRVLLPRRKSAMTVPRKMKVQLLARSQKAQNQRRRSGMRMTRKLVRRRTRSERRTMQKEKMTMMTKRSAMTTKNGMMIN